MKRIGAVWAIGGALSAGIVISACSADPEGNHGPTGSVAIALTEVPADVQCLEIRAEGQFPVVKTLEVTPGESSVFEIDGVATGSVEFSGEAFDVPCGSTAAAAPTWAGGPVQVTVRANELTPVSLPLYQIGDGQAEVSVDFVGAGEPSCASTGDACADASDCCSGDCVSGTCFEPDPTCSDKGVLCEAATDCCSGICLDGVCAPDGVSVCLANGDTCGLQTNVCCSGNCVNGTCGPEGVNVCLPNGETCGLQSNVCCSGNCTPNGACGPQGVTRCLADGEACGLQTNVCCSGSCVLGQCIP